MNRQNSLVNQKSPWKVTINLFFHIYHKKQSSSGSFQELVKMSDTQPILTKQTFMLLTNNYHLKLRKMFALIERILTTKTFFSKLLYSYQKNLKVSFDFHKTFQGKQIRKKRKLVNFHFFSKCSTGIILLVRTQNIRKINISYPLISTCRCELWGGKKC